VVNHDLRLRQLVDRTFVSGEAYFSLHRSLQEILLHKLALDIDHCQIVMSRVYKLIRGVYPPSTEVGKLDPTQWPAYEKYLPQVLALRKQAMRIDPRLSETNDMARLMTDSATYMWQKGMVYEGCQLLVSAEEVLNKLRIEPVHQMRVTIHFYIGGLLSREGIFKCPEQLYRRQQALYITKALVDRKSVNDVTPDDHLALGQAENGVGAAMLYCGRFDDAATHFNRASHFYSKIGTETSLPYHFAQNISNRAIVLAYQLQYMPPPQRDYRQAIDDYIHALCLCDQALGKRNGVTVSMRYFLTLILRSAGKRKESLDLLNEVLTTSIELSGEPDSQTLRYYASCGCAYVDCGQLDKAE
jgi:tetratricopeptide (TPR) repeat protein